MASRSKSKAEGIAGYFKGFGAAHWRQVELHVVQGVVKTL